MKEKWISPNHAGYLPFSTLWTEASVETNVLKPRPQKRTSSVRRYFGESFTYITLWGYQLPVNVSSIVGSLSVIILLPLRLSEKFLGTRVYIYRWFYNNRIIFSWRKRVLTFFTFNNASIMWHLNWRKISHKSRLKCYL